MVIAVCRVAPAHAIPDQDKDGKPGAGDENWHCSTRKKTYLCPDILSLQTAPNGMPAVTESAAEANSLTLPQMTWYKLKVFLRRTKPTQLLQPAF
jgi:hypothetical protein